MSKYINDEGEMEPLETPSGQRSVHLFQCWSSKMHPIYNDLMATPLTCIPHTMNGAGKLHKKVTIMAVLGLFGVATSPGIIPGSCVVNFNHKHGTWAMNNHTLTGKGPLPDSRLVPMLAVSCLRAILLQTDMFLASGRCSEEVILHSLQPNYSSINKTMNVIKVHLFIKGVGPNVSSRNCMCMCTYYYVKATSADG